MAVMKLVTAMNFLGINVVMNALIRSLEGKTRRRVPEYDPLCEHPNPTDVHQDHFPLPTPKSAQKEKSLH